MTEENNTPFVAIFDMDGVLLDSPSLNWQAMNRILANYNVNIPTEDVNKYLGRTLHDQVTQFNSDFDLQLDYDEFKAATDDIKKELFASIAPKEGVVELLKNLKESGVPSAVATSMPRDLTEQRLRTAGLLDYFDVVVTEEDVTHHKPNPEVFQKAAEQLGATSSHCVVFEDAPSGIQAARSADMACVAIETPYVSMESLSAADMSVNSLANITIAQIEQLITAHKYHN